MFLPMQWDAYTSHCDCQSYHSSDNDLTQPLVGVTRVTNGMASLQQWNTQEKII